MPRLALASVCLAFAATACAVPIKSAISPAALLARVNEAERARDAEDPALPRALSAQQPELRIAALRALARTGEVGTSSAAIPLLGDRDDEVARWAAFALGQIGDPAAASALAGALEGVSPAPDAVLMALGRVGTATSAHAVAAKLADPRPSVRAAAGLALGLLAKRLGKAVPAELYAAKVAPLVRDPDMGVRFGAAYALMRLASPASAVALVPILSDEDAEIRATAARGLGLSHAAPRTLDVVVRDPDWRVRVEVVRALAAMGKAEPLEAPQAASRLAAMIPRELARMKAGVLESGLATHVLLAIATAAGDLGDEGARLVGLLEKAPWTTEGLPAHAAPDLARLACAVAHALDQAEGVIRRVRSCGDASLPAWRRDQLVTRLLARQGTDAAVEELAQLAKHQDPRVRVAVVEALGEIERETAVQALLRLLDSNDPYVRSAAADALARPERVRFRPKGLVTRLASVLAVSVAEPDPGFAVSVIDALGALGDEAISSLPALEALSGDPRPAIRRRAASAREAITKKPVQFGRGAGSVAVRPGPAEGAAPSRVVLETSRGRITVELFTDVAPYTAGALLQLARDGFYRERTFHRIVPGFVAQGGCPRGDGYGGPGWALDEEVSMRPFVRGAVGIATSGRDTGGSQFFVMHAYHPHLDGGYAVAGRVIEGIEVADALEVDDHILDVRLEDGREPSPSVR